MTQRSFASQAMASAVCALLVLSGCSSDIVVDEPAQSGAASGQPNLDVNRIAEMLKDSQAVLTESDQKLDANLLGSRMSDPALRVRAAQYELAKKAGSSVTPLDLTEQVLTVTNSTDWPRVVLDVSKAESGALPAAYFFVQDDARSGYKLQNWTRLLGGTEFSTLSVEEGTPYLQADATGYLVTPKKAVEEYVAMLNSGTAGSQVFATDEFTNNYFSTVKKLHDSVSAAGEVTAQATYTDAPITSVRLRDGAALVASSIEYTHTYKRTIARSTMKLGGSPAILAGDPSIKGTAAARYVLTVLIYLPAEGSSAKAKLIGAERALESVSKDDAARPQGE